jgi:hypothetical protein
LYDDLEGWIVGLYDYTTDIGRIWSRIASNMTPPATGWVPGPPPFSPQPGDGTPVLSGGGPCLPEEGGLVFIPAYPATNQAEWSFLTRPVPTVTNANGQTEYLPVMYTFGEPIEVQFMLEDGDGRAVRDANVRLDLWKYDGEYGVGIGWRIMAFDISYDWDAEAYTTVIPTDGPDFKLLPGFYAWHLKTSAGEELAVLRMIIE